MEISAGGIIYRPKQGRRISRRQPTTAEKYRRHHQGVMGEGEEQEGTARRQVDEETGLRGEILQPLDRIEYWYVWDYGDGPERVHKFVYFFLLRYIDGSTDDHDHEADEARWFSISEARKRLTHDNEHRILNLAEKALEEVD